MIVDLREDQVEALRALIDEHLDVLRQIDLTVGLHEDEHGELCADCLAERRGWQASEILTLRLVDDVLADRGAVR